MASSTVRHIGKKAHAIRNSGDAHADGESTEKLRLRQIVARALPVVKLLLIINFGLPGVAKGTGAEWISRCSLFWK